MPKLHALHPDAQWVAVFLAGERQNLDEVMLLQQLEKCCTPLVIGMNQSQRRNECGVELYTCTDRNLAPKHMRDNATFVQVYADDGRPLTGGQLRMDQQARAAIQREQFDTPDDDEGQENAA